MPLIVKRISRIAVVFSMLAMTGFAMSAQAHDGEWNGKQRGKQHHFFLKKLAEELNLTDAQKTQAKALFSANRDAIKPIITSLKTERKTLHTLMHADTIDESAIRAETSKIAGIQADLNINRAKIGAQFRTILTPDQLAKLKTIEQKRQQRNAEPAQQ